MAPPDDREPSIPVPIVDLSQATPARVTKPPRMQTSRRWLVLLCFLGIVAAGLMTVRFLLTSAVVPPAAPPPPLEPAVAEEVVQPQAPESAASRSQSSTAAHQAPPEAEGATVVEEPQPASVTGPACPDYSGQWSGSWGASTSHGTWSAEFRQEQTDDGQRLLHGDIRVRGTACGNGGHIVGRINEDCGVEFDPYNTGPCRVRYRAVFDGDTMRGTLSAVGFGMADQGSWRGSRRAP